MFQTMMNDIFRDLITEGIMIVYPDNILIFIQTLKDYYKAVYIVLKVLAEHQLHLCSEKYDFDKQQIEYLELVISEDQVKIDPMKAGGPKFSNIF